MEVSAAEPSATVAARIQERMSELRASERKVARALLAHYPVGGLDTVASLAATAEVSAATVTRFATRLGYSGFPDLQGVLRGELHNLMGSPLEQYPSRNRTDAPDNDHALMLVRSALAGLVTDDLNRAATLLSNRATVFIVGGRFSKSLADYLYFHLMLLRRSVVVASEDVLHLSNHVTALGRNDVVVLFDYRRYDDLNVRLARTAHDRGATLLLLTDVWLSPASEFADVVLAAPVATPGGFDSLLGTMAICDRLIRAVASELGEAGRDHLTELEMIRDELAYERPAELSGRISSASAVNAVDPVA